jgi:hypothetical protein
MRDYTCEREQHESELDRADAQKCLGRIQGAKHLSLEQLEATGWVNEHIRAMKQA